MWRGKDLIVLTELTITAPLGFDTAPVLKPLAILPNGGKLYPGHILSALVKLATESHLHRSSSLGRGPWRFRKLLLLSVILV